MTIRIWNTEITISARHMQRRRNRRHVQYAARVSGRAVALATLASGLLAWVLL